MYSWKDKIWDGIAIGLVSFTCIPLVIFSLPLMLIAKLVDKIWPTGNYYEDRSYWKLQKKKQNVFLTA